MNAKPSNRKTIESRYLAICASAHLARQENDLGEPNVRKPEPLGAIAFFCMTMGYFSIVIFLLFIALITYYLIKSIKILIVNRPIILKSIDYFLPPVLSGVILFSAFAIKYINDHDFPFQDIYYFILSFIIIIYQLTHKDYTIVGIDKKDFSNALINSLHRCNLVIKDEKNIITILNNNNKIKYNYSDKDKIGTFCFSLQDKKIIEKFFKELNQRLDSTKFYNSTKHILYLIITNLISIGFFGYYLYLNILKKMFR